MYSDIKVVLENIKNHFENTLNEEFSFSLDPENRYAIFQSINHHIKVMACFIQARINNDFSVPIEQRITETQLNLPIRPNHCYLFSSRIVDNNTIPIQYTFEEIK